MFPLHLAKVEEHLALVGRQLDVQPLIPQHLVFSNVLQPGDVVAEDGESVLTVVQSQAFSQRFLCQRLFAIAGLDCVGGGCAHPTARLGVLVVIND